MPEQEECEFLTENIGTILLVDLKQHVASCTDCQRELEEAYQSYQNPEELEGMFEKLSLWNFDAIAKGLSKEEFLQSWHFSQSAKDEHKEAIYRKMFSKIGLLLLEDILSKQSTVFSLVALDAPRPTMESGVESLIKGYKDLKGLLSKDGFDYLVGDMDIIVQGMKIAFLQKKD